MTRQEAEKIMRDDMALSQEIKRMNDAIGSFIEECDKLFAEWNMLSRKINEFLNPANTDKSSPPFPAFAPSRLHTDGKKAFDIAMQTMNEALGLMQTVRAYREQYFEWSRDVTSSVSSMMESGKHLPKASPEEIAEFVGAHMGKMPSLHLRAVKMLEDMEQYQARMKIIKNNIAVLKEIN